VTTAPPRSATRRDELLAATRRVVARTGFSNVTVEQITREAGASLGLLHYHFASKDEVVAEAFAQIAREDLAALEAVAAAPGSAAERLAACLAFEVEDTASWRLWIDAWGEAVHVEPMRAVLASFQRSWRRVLSGLLADGVREGAWHCPDPEDMAARLVAGLDGIGLHATLHPSTVPAEQATAWGRRMVERELGVTLPGARRAPAPPPATPVERRVGLRSGDIDGDGQVDPAVYPALLAEGRAAWLAARRPPAELRLARMTVEHLAALRAEDGPVTVLCTLHTAGDDEVVLREVVRAAGGAVAAEAEVVLVAARPLEPHEREALAA
jgi:AcrR family transcriptional regulator/acyl-CoA thioesterase FadM